jgi:hypothetical protein
MRARECTHSRTMPVHTHACALLLRRSGGWVLAFPSASAAAYDAYFESVRPLNELLKAHLFRYRPRSELALAHDGALEQRGAVQAAGRCAAAAGFGSWSATDGALNRAKDSAQGTGAPPQACVASALYCVATLRADL